MPTRAQYKKSRTVFRILLEDGLADRLPELHAELTTWLLQSGESGISFELVDTDYGPKRAITLTDERGGLPLALCGSALNQDSPGLLSCLANYVYMC